MLSAAWLGPAFVVAVVLTLAGSLYAIARIDDPDGAWGHALRSRLVMGVPWGTLVTATLVLLAYLVVQDGFAQWRDPVTIPFRSWSWFYPTGVAFASFTHVGPGHLVGNLIGTLLFGSVAEYAYGHFPDKRGSQSFTSLTTNPFVRAFLFVPAAALVGGVALAAFGLGPVIGFSGVVFALAGFALVRYPMTTIVLALGGQSVASVFYSALQNPIVTAQVTPSPPSPPWWAGIAIQGHALGLLLGIVAAAVVFSRRSEGPSALRLYVAVLFFGVSKSLWAIYFIESSDRFVLFRAPGLVAVFVLAVLVAGAVASRGDGSANPLRLLEGTGSAWRTVALAALVVTFAVVAGMALPTKLNTTQASSIPGENPVEVRDYTVTYAEGTEYTLVSAVDVPFVELPTENVTASGVIVVSERRSVWYPAVSKGQLAFGGSRQVDVGGVSWRDSVWAIRRGWSANGGPTTYKVWLQRPNESANLAFTADAATADPVLDGKNVSVAATETGFAIVVSRNNATLARTTMPSEGGNATVAGISFEREGRHVYAVVNETRVKVFTKEKYGRNR
ncbi:rhomboid family intramembrane serine protease [Halorubellus salinus]|uniref:rhomboid family intramembrane serine protease n=1 Tax=Halorubellus salinus TaxID=755309 RepID=UPI001D064C89|nr:rhomboid family intramembrane serine protease [Halorubellus salinus]